MLEKVCSCQVFGLQNVGKRFNRSQSLRSPSFFHDLIEEDMNINVAFQVVVVIENPPLSWKDFKNYLKHKHNEVSLEDLVICLKIEDDKKLAKKKLRCKSIILDANLMEDTAPNSKSRKRSSR